MLKTTGFLFCALLIMLNPLKGFTQISFENIVKQDLYTSGRSIVNGIAWTNSVKYQGNRFCGSSQWKNGDVKFNGKLYCGLLINYDILDDALILYDDKFGEEKYVKINSNFIEMFQYADEHVSRTFVNIELIPSKGKEIYEEVFTSTFSFYIKHKKSVKQEIGPVYMGQLYDNNTYYLSDESGAHSFKNKKTILQILGNSKELKKYIRKEKLKINKNHSNDIVRLLVFNESLITVSGIKE